MANSIFNLSTLNGTNGFAINGINFSDFSGRSVSSAGDINGDGIDDIIIGAGSADPNGLNNSGQSYVVFGSRSAFNSSFNLSTLTGSNGFVINGFAANDNSGRSVSSAGDINGDGIDDLIIGAFGADPNGIAAPGQSYVVFGKRSGFTSSLNLSTLTGTNGFAINGIVTGDFSGWSVSSAGDINGDGIDDVIIGARYAGPNGIESGQSYVVFGSRSGFGSSLNLSTLTDTNGFKINGIAASNSGYSVSSAGDINGDGIDDLIIGAFVADPNGISGSGQSYVVFGSRSGFTSSLNLSTLNGSNGFKINGIAVNDASGWSVSSAGDINGDGIDDLIIGALFADPNGLSSSGQSYVVFGGRNGFSSSLDLSALNGTNGFKINGIAAGDLSGGSVSSAGDINGDGIDDLIIGASDADPNGIGGSGQSYVVFGSRSGFSASLNLSTLNGTNGFKVNGINFSDFSGRSVSSAGDINGDGIDDVIIGASSADPNNISGSGQSYVVYGNAAPELDLNGTNNLIPGFKINGIAAYDYSGRSVSNAGDINGDGIDDIIIGAHRADPNGNQSGQSYVVFGSRNGFSSNFNLSTLSGTNGFKINGIAAGDYSGRSVSSAGDINGDGIDDLIIGASGAPFSSARGQSYVVFGSRSTFSSNLNLSTINGTNGFKINGISGNDRSGYSVSSAGDINGDGIDDLIIGAYSADPNGSNSGQSYIVFGSRSTFSSNLDLSSLNGNNGFAINGTATGDYSGRSVSSAGDINGDGIDDLIIGASYADPNGSNSGQSYVVFGSRSTFSSNLNLSSLNGNNGFAINGINASNQSGYSVSSAGDINGDGIDDIIIGARFASPNGSRSGQSYIVFGSRSGFSSNFNLSTLDGINGFKINGINAFNYSGRSVSSAGDINGDGIDDLIIGADRANPNGTQSGQSYVIFGSRSGFSPTINLSTLNGTNGFKINGIAVDDISGRSVSSAGDINGDGIDDLVIGAYRADPNGISSSGQSYVIFGQAGIGSSGTLELSQLSGSTTDGIDFNTTFTGTAIAVVDTDLSLLDRNSANLAGATITITNPLNGAAETLSATTTGSITSSYSNGVLTLSGNGTVAQYQQVLRTVTYNNTAPSPISTPRAITFVVDDGAASSNTSIIATTTLLISATATIAITSANTASFAENGTGTAYTVTATSSTPSTAFTYSLSGTDATLFDISGTGAITFKATPNFEAPTDNGANNIYDINVIATNGSLTASKAVTISVTNVNEAPTITSPAAVNFAENGTGTAYVVNAIDPEGTALVYGLSGTDAALFNISSTGAITFKAAPNFEDPTDNGANNVYDINVITNDGVLNASKAVAISVTNVNEAPIVVTNGNGEPIANQSTAANAPFSFTVPVGAFADVDAGDTLTLSATLANNSPLPTWLSFNSSTGIFSGTPTNANIDTINIKVTATDTSGASVSDEFNLVVTSTNNAPTLVTSIENQTTDEDAPFSFTIPPATFADADAGDTLALTATLANGSLLPSWLTFNANTGTFSGTPANENVGTISVKVTATDAANASVSDEFELVITNTNDAPTLVTSIANQSTAENAPFSFTVPLGTFADIDAGDTLTFSATLADGLPLPTWLSFDDSTGIFSGIPTNEDVGNINVKITATDTDGVAVSDEFNLVVTNINNAPTLSTEISDLTAAEDAPFSFTIPLNTFADVDAGDTLALTATLSDGSALPSWLIFNANTRNFSGIPANGDVGTISVKITATDAANAFVSEEFDLVITNTNDAPTLAAAIANQSTAENTPFSFTIPLETFADVDTDDTLILNATLANGLPLPSWLTFNTNTGTFSGTPTNSDVRTISVKVTATDSSNTFVSDEFNLTVVDNTPPPAPLITGISNDTGVSNTDRITSDTTLMLSGTAEANSTVQLFRANASIGTATTNASGNWSFDYTGTTLSNGTYNFTATATDAAGNISLLSAPLSVTVDTTAPNQTATITGMSPDPGASSTDFLTNDGTTSRTYSGGLSAPLLSDEILQISVNGGTNWSNATASGATWTFVDNSIQSSDWTIQARVIDLAGLIVSKAVTLDQQISAASAIALDLAATRTLALATPTTPPTLQLPPWRSLLIVLRHRPETSWKSAVALLF